MNVIIEKSKHRVYCVSSRQQINVVFFPVVALISSCIKEILWVGCTSRPYAQHIEGNNLNWPELTFKLFKRSFTFLVDLSMVQIIVLV